MQNIEQVHCQQCGRTDEESVGFEALRDNDGYTSCCNERPIYGGRDVFNRPVKCDPAECSHR